MLLAGTPLVEGNVVHYGGDVSFWRERRAGVSEAGEGGDKGEGTHWPQPHQVFFPHLKGGGVRMRRGAEGKGEGGCCSLRVGAVGRLAPEGEDLESARVGGSSGGVLSLNLHLNVGTR